MPTATLQFWDAANWSTSIRAMHGGCNDVIHRGAASCPRIELTTDRMCSDLTMVFNSVFDPATSHFKLSIFHSVSLNINKGINRLAVPLDMKVKGIDIQCVHKKATNFLKENFR